MTNRTREMSRSEWLIRAKQITTVNHLMNGAQTKLHFPVTLSATKRILQPIDMTRERRGREGGKGEALGPVGSCSGGQGNSCGTPTFRTINFP